MHTCMPARLPAWMHARLDCRCVYCSDIEPHFVAYFEPYLLAHALTLGLADAQPDRRSNNTRHILQRLHLRRRVQRSWTGDLGPESELVLGCHRRAVCPSPG